MKKTSVMVLVVLLVLCILMTAAFAAYKVYRHMEWNNYIVQEKLDGINDSFEGLLYYADNYPLDVDHYNFDYSWLDEGAPLLVAHALGGIDGQRYTNSLEAMELAYRNGIRIFEADMQLVDGDIVLLHDRSAAAEMCGFENSDFGSDEFLAARIMGKYSPMDWRDVLEFMQTHPDVYIITDTKYTEQPHMSYIISAIASETAELDAALLDRVIVQIYSHHMLDTVMDIYPFRSVIFTLYMSPDDDEKVRAFCAQSGIEAVTMPEDRCSREFVSSLSAMGIRSLTHTVNEADKAREYIDFGIAAVYTDFLVPGDIANNRLT